MDAPQAHDPCNGAMGRRDDAKLQDDGVNGIAKQAPCSNGMSDLTFDTVEDTIEAFSTPCPPPSPLLLPSTRAKDQKIV